MRDKSHTELRVLGPVLKVIGGSVGQCVTSSSADILLNSLYALDLSAAFQLFGLF
jgi:hypothetical protein